MSLTLKRPNRILLGKTSNGEEVYMRYPEKNGRGISDVILIVGVTGSGKSVIKKSIAYQMAKRRPVILLDPPGRDDYLSFYPNHTPNLPPKIKADGLRGLYFYYPNLQAREKRRHEILRRPNFKKYSMRQLKYLGITQTAAIFIKNLLDEHKDIDSFDKLLEMIEKEGKKLPPLSKRSLMNTMPYIAANNNLRMDNKEDVNLMACFKSGYNMIFSFNDIALAKIEINYLFDKLIEYRDTYPDGHRPFVFIDEAHKIFGDANSDVMSKLIEDFVLVCRKLSIGLCLVFPEIESINNRVLSDIKTMIFGKYKGAKDKLRLLFGDNNAYNIPNLKLNRYTNERQFVFYTQDYEYFFIMDKVYEAPCGIHRE